MTDRYTYIKPPESLKPIEPGLKWDAGMIDYSKHPAYSDFVSGSGLFYRISTLATFLANFSLLLVKRVVHYEVIPYENRAPRSLSERIGFLFSGLKNIFSGSKPVAKQEPKNPVTEELRSKGIAAVLIPAGRFQEAKAMAESHFEKLAQRRGKKESRREFDESRSTVDPRDSAEFVGLINKVLEEGGVLDAASRYVGRELHLVDVNPQINDPSDTFWTDIFPDRKNDKLPRTAYYHRDASGGDIKAIIYFSDVGPKNGPFAYATGSNRMQISRLDDLLREANDHNGLSSTSPQARKRFSALPAKLRQKGAFGNDQPDDSLLTRAIASAEWEVTAPAGSIVLFDTKGIHRGGMVEQGERRVITCVLG